MAGEKRKGSKIGMMLHLIVYTFLITALAGIIYLDYDHVENEVKILMGEAVDIEPVVDEVSIMQEEALSELKENHMNLRSDYNQTLMDFEDLQTRKDDLETEVERLKQKCSLQENRVSKHKARKVKDTASCYEMYNGSYHIDKKCEKTITRYVDKHKNASYFEIVGIVDNLEFQLLTRLENNRHIYGKLRTSQESVNNLKKFSQMGLAKFRAMEASWVIKMHTKKKAVTYDAHYQLVSKKGQRGVLVRAYK